MDVTHIGDDAADARLVERVQRGDTAAFGPLFERWYDRVYGVARGVVRRPDLASDVAQDAFIAAWQQIDRLDDVNAFGGWLLRIARNRALDALRHEQRSSATDDDTLTALNDRGLPGPVAARQVAGPAEAAESHAQADLLWAAAAALGERDASILDLHVRHGLTPAELAADLGVEPNHAHQLVHRLRKRLGDAVGAFLLWNGGAPNCDVLAARGVGAFDAAAATTITRHARTCTNCADARAQRTDPVKLFAALPVAIAPLAYRSKAAWALESAGAPMPRHLLEPVDATSTSDDESNGGNDTGGRRSSMVTRVALVATLVVVVLGASAVLFADQARAPAPDLADAARVTTTTRPATTVATPTTSVAVTTTAPPPTTSPPPTPPPAPPTPPPAPPPAPTPRPPRREPVVPVPPAPPPTPDPIEPTVDTTTTTTSRLAPPTIVRFVLRPATHGCNTKALSRAATWLTEGAASGEVQWAGGTVDIGASPTGSTPICIEEGSVATLVVSNAAGESTSASAAATP